MRSNTLKSVLIALGTTNAATMLDEFHEVSFSFLLTRFTATNGATRATLAA